MSDAQTYEAFINETGLLHDAGTTGTGHLTLESLLQEKKAFDVAVRFEKLGVDNDSKPSWSIPAPSAPTVLASLPSSSNILTAQLEQLADDQGYCAHSLPNIQLLICLTLLKPCPSCIFCRSPSPPARCPYQRTALFILCHP